ncbi:MAG: hypothetical protein NZ952_00885 [Candidatus Bathyarchaeota archaeon]|nr:hypothetical protein [Candidatus Bathyarchaeota archaeon]
MESKKYMKFLEHQAHQNPVRIEGSLKSEKFRISWQSPEGKHALPGSSDIIESLYLGREMQESVVVDRRIAMLLQDRLRGLEEENIRMRKRLKLQKLLNIFLLALLALLLSYLILSQYMINVF